ncbi:CoA-acylating methylmalonate-semialdehyde dehydrogenase [Actinomyces wuliandei]|uniref:CoA-acylating methylmalonate-semialdehyde dehydrogenase n=1 Tax=Actinomyces wuliandei TaxID=2057743 RepID=UPI000FD83BC3|nr:CoA-acylating methylmalonate-semialdehyde dehydrogenase [Actinomyces wuliandei]
MTVKHWVSGGPWTGSGTETLPIENPATGEVIDELVLASEEDLDHVVEVAREAQKKWARTSLAKRVDVMFRMRELVNQHADELAELIVREGGKTHGDALGEIARGRETIDFACGINAALKGEFTDQAATGVDVHTLRQPVGVVAGICPFNFPVMVPMWMHPIALATGNAFILKVASLVPSASLKIAELYKEAGLPDGLFNVVAGNRTIVTRVLEHPGIDAISFVGSSPVAHIVQDTGVSHGKRVQALGGANNHAIVMPDANMEFAAQHVSAGAFGAAGQRCMALPVVVAVGDAAERLIPLVKERAQAIVTGPGTDKASEMGPVITRKDLQRIEGWIARAEEGGADVVLDGRGYRPEGEDYQDGFWLGPTIVDRVPTEQSLYCEETFGPVLVVVRAETYEEAIELVNSSEFGNGAAIFTSDGDAARQFVVDVEAGMVGVNVPIPVPVAYYSFGGWKESLLGDHHIHGPEGVRFYTRGKVVTSRWARRGEKVGYVGMNFPTNG